MRSDWAAVHINNKLLLNFFFIRRSGWREFQILEAATVKLRAPNEVRTNGTETGLVFDNLGERVGSIQLTEMPAADHASYFMASVRGTCRRAITSANQPRCSPGDCTDAQVRTGNNQMAARSAIVHAPHASMLLIRNERDDLAIMHSYCLDLREQRSKRPLCCAFNAERPNALRLSTACEHSV